MKRKKPVFAYTDEQAKAASEFTERVEDMLELAKKAGAQKIEIKIRTGMGSRISWHWPAEQFGKGSV